VDKNEAATVLEDELLAYRHKTYAELSELVSRSDHHSATGPSGATYELDIQVLRDSSKTNNLRVMGAISEAGDRLSFQKPFCSDFIISPEGTFIGE